MNSKTAAERIRYSRQFLSVLQTGDASPLLGLSPGKRVHILKGLASLSRFLGCYDVFLKIRQRYNLKWSTGNESLTALSGFFDDNKSLETMLDWVRRAIAVLPPHRGSIVKFNCLTGLRPKEARESVRLIFLSAGKYYNSERQCLEHFRFPEIFIRRTKTTYISFITKEQLSAIGILDCKNPVPTYESIRFRLERAGVQCHLAYCRKIFASWLHRCGISEVIIDLLQGRVGKSILVNHYLRSDAQ